MGRHLSPRYSQVILVSGYLVLKAVNGSQHWRVSVFLCSDPKLARKYETKHWSRSRKIINWSADSFQINHVTLMSWNMSPRYGHGILVSGYPVLTAVNWPYCECPILKSYIKDVYLPRHAWDTPPFLLIVSPYPTRTICRRVRTYARSITWQPNEKRLTIFHEYGALSHARFARAGAPLIIEKCCRFEANTQLGPVPRKTVKFNPGLCEISSLQNTVEPLLRNTVMIYTKCFSKQCIGR